MPAASVCVKILQLLCVLLLVPYSLALARIGETALQLVDRYGPPKDTPVSKNSDKLYPLLEGAIQHRYEHKGWKIRAAFLELDGPCVRMEFQKMALPAIQDYELEAIMTANAPAGMAWKRIIYDNPDSPNGAISKLGEAYFATVIGQKMWERSDGAVLWLRSPLSVRLELPAAREREAQLKVTKDKKERASVPNF